MKAKAIQICGTGSGVGKSVLTAALCRIFLQDGYTVAPFKSQNMALNSFVTETGGEIGRAQAIQAYASKIKPTVDINPILIKPTRDTQAQIIVHGKPIKNMSVYEYKNYKNLAFPKVKESLKRLQKKYEIIVIEGAGSPVEINLKKHDLVNLKIAKLAQAPVFIVGDIDKGGVFAWLIGTLQLMTQKEKKMVKGFIINKFRGDKRLLMPGVKFLEKYTGIKVLGVIPYYHDINIPEEDSVRLERESRQSAKAGKTQIKINVIHLPHISNFTDFDALEQEPDVNLSYIKKASELNNPDIIIIPGTKNTIQDLIWLRKTGLADKIRSAANDQQSTILIGICGGYQILGKRIYDKKAIESKIKEIEGLGILPIATELRPEKILAQVKAKHLPSSIEVNGYEIHHGKTKESSNLKILFQILQAGNKKIDKCDGLITQDGRCWGTYIHGIFDSDQFRRYFLNRVRKQKGWQELLQGHNYDIDKEIDKLAYLVRKNIDLDLLYKTLLKGRVK